jgi:hypothetical protein
MKPAFVCLLAFAISACSPLPETEEETERRLRKHATPTPPPTPVPTPKPGAWMQEKRDNPLGIKNNPLDQKPTK